MIYKFRKTIFANNPNCLTNISMPTVSKLAKINLYVIHISNLKCNHNYIYN